MEGSSLREVFGSTASLSELSGDTDPSVRTPVGYSRFGLNEHRPTHQMHTRVRRSSNEGINGQQRKTKQKFAKSGSSTPSQSAKSRPLYVRAPVLAICGLGHSLLMHLHVPPSVELPLKEQLNMLVLSTLVATLAGLIIPKTDACDDASAASTDGKAIDKNKSEFKRSQNRQKTWKVSLMRLYGALLGLVYFANKLPNDATRAWLLIAPSMWYIANTSFEGLLAALGMAVAGALVTIAQCVHSPAFGAAQTLQSNLFVFGGSAAAYFGTALVFAEIGRGLS